MVGGYNLLGICMLGVDMVVESLPFLSLSLAKDDFLLCVTSTFDSSFPDVFFSAVGVRLSLELS